MENLTKPETIEKMKDVPDAHIQQAAETLPEEALAIFKRIVEAAEAAKPKLKKREALKKLGNSDAADQMDMCLCFWDEAKAKALLQKEVDKGAISAVPDELNGAIMAVSDVAWKTPEDAKKWTSYLKEISALFFEHRRRNSWSTVSTCGIRRQWTLGWRATR